jgi:hypothetical protein
LFYAGTLACDQALIEAGADIHHREKSGETVLFDSAFDDHFELVKFYVGQGVDVNYPQPGYSPILKAATSGRIEMVEFLLSHGASLEDRNDCGYTLLHEAAWWRGDKLVEWLLAKGADANVESKFGETPADRVLTGMDTRKPDEDEKRTYERIIEILRQAGGEKGSGLFQRIDAEDEITGEGSSESEGEFDSQNHEENFPVQEEAERVEDLELVKDIGKNWCEKCMRHTETYCKATEEDSSSDICVECGNDTVCPRIQLMISIFSFSVFFVILTGLIISESELLEILMGIGLMLFFGVMAIYPLLQFLAWYSWKPDLPVEKSGQSKKCRN